jgi:hypothetical protein
MALQPPRDSWQNSASVELVAARLRDCAAVFLQTKAAPIQICSHWIGALDGTRPLPMRTDNTALCCRFVFQSSLGHQVTSRFNKTLPSHTPRLPAEPKASHSWPSTEAAEKTSLGQSGFDFQQADSVQRMDR